MTDTRVTARITFSAVHNRETNEYRDAVARDHNYGALTEHEDMHGIRAGDVYYTNNGIVQAFPERFTTDG